jgi:osmotically-inducible protein OsmY
MSQDRQLQEAVLAELSWDRSIEAAHIGVAASSGIITLTGNVNSFAEKHAAEMAANRVKGVKAVIEKIEVTLPFEHQYGDDQLIIAIIERLAWNTSVPNDSVKVVVEKGWVTLSGEVDWHHQKEAAEQDIKHMAGLVGISNRIMIKSHLNIQDLTHKITSALHRAWFFKDNNVKITTNNGHVHLMGTVHSPTDRINAQRIAWGTPGVTHVKNDIAISVR